jgi:hypothetical protein
LGFKKKLYQFCARDEKQIETHFTKKRVETVRVTSVSLERENRQMLSDKISGTYVGLWLLLPEHLRLGTWDLLKAWSGIHDANAIEPRLALQLIHESALCLNGVRQRRSLRQKGFETLNGLPFVATDSAIHHLLDQHTVKEALSLQLALGKMRQLRGHYPGKTIILDPHRITTWSKRQMPLRKNKSDEPATKTLQTFFAIDADSGQPYVTGIGSSAVTATQGTLPLLEQLSALVPNEALILMDKEHFTEDILKSLVKHPKFTFLMPAIRYQNIMNQIEQMTFTRHYAGYASAEGKYQIPNTQTSIRLLVQRIGETEDDYEYQPFLTDSTLPAETLMTILYPERWTIEELFNFCSSLGWNRASTLNLNIRIGKLSFSLIAQAVIYQFRQKLSGEMATWNHQSLAQKVFTAIDGDIRVKNDTILVTLYNAPNVEFFKEHYENLPLQLEKEGIDPKIPWLYDFKLDFRFK